MDYVLVDAARKRLSDKRGGDVQRVDMEAAAGIAGALKAVLAVERGHGRRAGFECNPGARVAAVVEFSGIGRGAAQ